jgi:hypothetical protein
MLASGEATPLHECPMKNALILLAAAAGVGLVATVATDPQPEQHTSSQGVPAISAAGIVGDYSMSRLAESCSFRSSTTPFASARAAASATCRLALVQCPGPTSERPCGSIRGLEPSIQPMRLVSIREAAVLHALLDIGTPDFRGLTPWYAFVHLLAARGAGVVPFSGMIADRPGAAGQRRKR